MRVAVPIVLSPEERTTLEHWARGRRTPARLVLRAKIVLRAAAGRRNDEIAGELATDRECVGRWRTRFAAQRLAGIERDAPRPGRTPAGLQARGVGSPDRRQPTGRDVPAAPRPPRQPSSPTTLTNPLAA